MHSVTKIIQQALKMHLGNGFEIVIRDRSNLKDHIYNPQSLLYNNPQNKKRFDLIDMVVMEGEPTILPWHSKNSQFQLLFLMCKQTDKPLYASGFGVQLLAHFCAVGHRCLNILNNKQRGSSLDDIQPEERQIQANIQQPDNVLLDNRTGDFYEANEKNEWQCGGNVGLHWVNALGREAQMVKKTPQFEKRVQKYQPILSILKMSDTKCHIRKHLLNHWLCEGLPEVFIADAGNTWDPHPLNLGAQTVNIIQHNYTVLVDGARAPVVTLHKKSVATQFGFHKDYRESVLLFNNFIKHTYNNQSKGLPYDLSHEVIRRRQHNILDQRLLQQSWRQQDDQIKKQALRQIATEYDQANQKFTTENEFRYSGSTVSLRNSLVKGPLLVSNTSVNKSPVTSLLPTSRSQTALNTQRTRIVETPQPYEQIPAIASARSSLQQQISSILQSQDVENIQETKIIIVDKSPRFKHESPKQKEALLLKNPVGSTFVKGLTKQFKDSMDYHSFLKKEEPISITQQQSETQKSRKVHTSMKSMQMKPTIKVKSTENKRFSLFTHFKNLPKYDLNQVSPYS